MNSIKTPFTSFLDSIIKLLLVILILICSYFFYQMKQRDLSFQDVFNQKELHSALISFESMAKELNPI